MPHRVQRHGEDEDLGEFLSQKSEDRRQKGMNIYQFPVFGKISLNVNWEP